MPDYRESPPRRSRPRRSTPTPSAAGREERVEMPRLSPMDLLQVSAPFDDPDFLYEVKFDGFRALAYVEDGHCEIVSRKGHVYRRFADLCQ